MAEEIKEVEGKSAGLIEKYNVPKVAVTLRIIFETYRVLKSAIADYEAKTTRNTVQTVVSLGSSLAGSYAGSAVGRMVATAAKPERETKIGGIVGAVLGAIVVSRVGTTVFNKISDACDYNIEEAICVNCKKTFKRRKYKDDKKSVCGSCELETK